MAKPRRKRSRVDATGRNPDAFGRNNAVLIIRRSLWQSPRISALSPAARALMIELLSMYNGSNNGTLFLSLQDATDRLGFIDWRAAASAFAELEASGLITKTVEGYFDIKAGVHSRARAWRLNWIGDDGERLAPEALTPFDDATLNLKSRKRLERRQTALKRYFREHSEGKFAAVVSTTLDARRPENVADPTVETTTLKSKNGENPPIAQMVKTTAHLSYQGDRAPQRGWWDADAAIRARVSAHLVALAWIAGSLEKLSNNQTAAAATSLAA
jgi:hypothetical protein